MVKTKASSKSTKSSKKVSTRHGKIDTMENLLSKYGKSDKKVTISQGDIVTGRIVEITNKKVVVDIDGKSEGLVAEKAFSEAREFVKTLEVGDEITAKVIVSETPDGYVILSFRQAAQEASWKKIEESFKLEKPILVMGVSHKPAGLTVDIEGLTGFIPTSLIGKEVSKNPQALVNEHFKAVVIDLDKSDRKIVLSERMVSEAEDMKKIKSAINKLKLGDVYTGKITNIASFGCFVEIKIPLEKAKIPVEGLVHISEVSWDKVESLSKLYSEGDRVKVKIIDVKEGKVAMSIKKSEKDPWEGVAKKYKKDKKVKGKVTKHTDFGVFIQLEPGVEGLIHITKVPPGQKLNRGDEVNVYIEEIDVKNKKISLGLVLTAKPVGYR